METTALIETLTRLRGQAEKFTKMSAAAGFSSPEFRSWRAGVAAVLSELGPKNRYLSAFEKITFAVYEPPRMKTIKPDYF